MATTRTPRTCTAAFAVLLALFLALAVLAGRAFRETSSANRRSVYTYQVLSRTGDMEEGIARMQAAYRGYALTGRDALRAEWSDGRAEFLAAAAALHRLLADEPAQRERLRDAERAFSGWEALQRQSRVMAPGRGGSPAAMAAAAEPAAATARAEAVEAVRRAVSGLAAVESARLGTRASRAASAERRTGALLLAGGALGLLLALALAAEVLRRTRWLATANRALEAEVAEKVAARDALARLSRQNERILAAAAEGIVGVGADGRTRFVNPAAARTLGVDAEAAAGRPVAALLGIAGDEAAERPIRATLSTGDPAAGVDATFHRADGSAFPAEYACTPMTEDAGPSGAVVTFRDVTERREVERIKDEFVSVVSHELRTPLTSIRGSLGLLAAGKLGPVPEKGQRMLDIAVQNTDRLVRLINDILDIERIESGRAAMEMRAVDAADLVRQAVEVMGPVADRAEVALVSRADAVPLVADPDRILQVLTNLLSNAVKFSPAGAEVEVAAAAEGGRAVFRVRDRGRGIPADRLESIFERFQQVDSSDARDHGGTGLGLAISRTIVQQHGGRISVDSTPGEGSTFTVALPLGTAVEPAPAEPDGAGPLVLVCDDDASVVAVVEEILRGWGYRTVGVTDGESAVREAARLHPEAILLDMVMPGMSGAETIQALRGRAETRSIPVVILSVLKPLPRVQRGADVVDWVEKPFREEGLVRSLEEAVARRWKPRRVLVVEDDPDLARVLTEVFSRHGIEAVRAATGVEAVEAARRTPPDLVVLDLGLPHGDGYWVVETLRGDGGPQVPLVVYTAREIEEGDRERLRLGHTEFLTKGRVPPEEFERRVVSLLNRITPARRAAD